MLTSERAMAGGGADAFDDAAAAAFDFAARELSAAAKKRSRASALSAIVVALADARGRIAGDEAVVADLDRARAALGRAMEGDDDPLAALVPALDRTRRLAIERAARAPARMAEASPALAPLTASRGTPALHRDVRLEAAPRPVAPRAFGAIAMPITVEPRDPAERALRRLAKDALEEIGTAGRLRRPREDEAWTSGRSFEERALTFLDALVSLGRGTSREARLDVASVIDETLHAWSVPDPARVFAGLFALSCIHGHGAAARLHVHARDVHPSTTDAVEDALALGSSPHLDDVVLALLCEDDRPDLLARGLRAAKRRRRVPARFAIDLLGHPEPRVAAAAAEACGVLDPRLVREPLEEALFGAPEVAVAAAEALARLGTLPASWGQRLATLGGSLRAARLCVLAARPGDVEAMIALAGSFPQAIAMDLLGWIGSPLALDTLREALGDDDWNVRDRAAWSLARITGAGRELLGNLDVDEDGNPIPDPDEAPDSGSVSPDYTRRCPPLDPAFWSDPIERARAADARRLRFGRPLAAAAVIEELADPRTHQGIRRILVTELAILITSQSANRETALPLDVDDWIARQEHLLSLARDAGWGR
jgi:hypothetical protein